MGQSWGVLYNGIRFEIQKNLKGLIISNMMAGAEYNAYAKDVLAPQMDPKILKQLQDIEIIMDFDIKIQ
jgi:proline iminopeptidase